MKLSAVLLVGGESMRMGRDKATLVLNGEPLWERQLSLLRSLAPVEILISGRVDPIWRPPDTTFVSDSVPSRGPLGGLASAIAAINGTHLLALAVDMPFLTTTNLQGISDRAKPGCGVLPFIGSRAEPLAAIYPRESTDELQSALKQGELSLQRVTKTLISAKLLCPIAVSQPDMHWYQSVNTPADLARAKNSSQAYVT